MKSSLQFNKKHAAVLVLLLGAFLAITPAGLRQVDSHSPDGLAQAIVSKSNLVTPDQLSEWIIDERPDLLIVDLRSPQEFTDYHIKGAVNMPLSSLFEDDNLDLFSEDMVNVLYTNGEAHASQAWLLLQQKRIDTFVLAGGLNHWVKAILNPSPPSDLAPDSEVLQYQFRKSASGFFSGGNVVSGQQATKELPKATPKIKFRKMKKKAEEGC